jgi:hypothetical protein
MKRFITWVSNIWQRKLTEKDLRCPRCCSDLMEVKAMNPLITYCKHCDEEFIDTVASVSGFIPQGRKNK